MITVRCLDGTSYECESVKDAVDLARLMPGHFAEIVKRLDRIVQLLQKIDTNTWAEDTRDNYGPAEEENK